MGYSLLSLAVAAVTSNLPSASTPVDGGPDTWIKYVLGPLGALCLAIAWIVWTEKYRIPRFGQIVDNLTEKLEKAIKDRDELRNTQSVSKEELRDKYEAAEKETEKKLSDWRSRHTKEKALRVYWEALARQAYKRLDEPPPEPPTDDTKTHYGE